MPPELFFDEVNQTFGVATVVDICTSRLRANAEFHSDADESSESVLDQLGGNLTLPTDERSEVTQSWIVMGQSGGSSEAAFKAVWLIKQRRRCPWSQNSTVCHHYSLRNSCLPASEASKGTIYHVG